MKAVLPFLVMLACGVEVPEAHPWTPNDVLKWETQGCDTDSDCNLYREYMIETGQWQEHTAPAPI